MYIAVIPNRNSRPAILLRQGYREGGKVKNRTLANLSHWPPERIEALRQVLRGATTPLTRLHDAFEIERSRPHGHVAAVLGTMRRLGLEATLDRKRSAERQRCVAMIAARIIEPCSKLATARGLGPETLSSTLGEVLGVEGSNEDELYAAMDWLLERQERIEKRLAKGHLAEGAVVLYDVTSTYFEGRTCPLARLGHSRNGKKGKPQVSIGLLCNAEGCPVAVEVFEGNVAGPRTLARQIEKVRKRFALSRVVLVGDRGMITEARIREELRGVEGLEWITALRAPAVQALAKSGSLQLGLFDQRGLAEITHPRYPGERLVVCKNPLLAEERRRKREELLQSTERELAKVALATRRTKNRLCGKEKIALRVGKVLGRFKVGKHFRLRITDESFSYERNEASISKEAALDGIYVLRTSVSAERLQAAEVVRCYKALCSVERAFRSLKTLELHVRPIYHRKAERVRAHVLLCMLAYYVEWHMRRALAPMLFDDDDKARAEAVRSSPVAPAVRSRRALEKAAQKRTQDGVAVHSFRSLLGDLATVAKNRIKPKAPDAPAFDLVTTPTPLQQRAFELLGVNCRM